MKVHRAAKTGWRGVGGLLFDFLCVCGDEIGGLSPFFSLDIAINYLDFREMHRSTKAKIGFSMGNSSTQQERQISDF